MALEPNPGIVNAVVDVTVTYPDATSRGNFEPTGCIGTEVVHNPIYVHCANNGRVGSFGTITLNIPTLPALARRASVFREMQKLILSAPVLSDNGCTVTFYKKEVLVKNAKQVPIVRGTQDRVTGLWLVPISNIELERHWTKMRLTRKQRPGTFRNTQQLRRKIYHRANSAYRQRILPHLAACLHACAGDVPPATWIQAINQGWFSTWPGLTTSITIPLTSGNEPEAKNLDDSMRESTKPEDPRTSSKGQTQCGGY